MKCPMCSDEISDESRLVGPYTILQRKIHQSEESGEIKVCGRCFLLVSINKNLQQILEKLNG